MGALLREHAQLRLLLRCAVEDREMLRWWRLEAIAIEAAIDAEDREQALLHLGPARSARHHVGDVADVVPGAERRIEPVVRRQLDQPLDDRAQRGDRRG